MFMQAKFKGGFFHCMAQGKGDFKVAQMAM